MEDKVVVCNRCLCKVYPSCLDEYAYQCLEHDEDLYSIETHILNKNVYLHMMADRINCPIEKMMFMLCSTIYMMLLWKHP